MTFAYASILIVFFIAYLTVLYAKLGGKYNNNSPRVYLANLEDGPRKRAYWAYQNSFEIFPLYIAAVLIAHMQSVDQTQLDMIAAGFVLSRVLFVFAYILDKPTIRSIVWAGGFGCIIGLFLLPI